MEKLTTVARNNPYMTKGKKNKCEEKENLYMNKRKERNVKKGRNPYVKKHM